MIESVTLSPALCKKLVRQSAALSIRKSVLNTMAQAHPDMLSDEGMSFISKVATANSDYRMLVYQATQEAVAAGYDPVIDGTLSIIAERGVATWSPVEQSSDTPDATETDPAGEEERGTSAGKE